MSVVVETGGFCFDIVLENDDLGFDVDVGVELVDDVVEAHFLDAENVGGRFVLQNVGGRLVLQNVGGRLVLQNVGGRLVFQTDFCLLG